MKKKFFNKKHVRASYRSGLEEKVAAELTSKNIPYGYESEKLEYIIPAKVHKYTPDFILTKKDGSKMYIETKGYWPAIERKKLEHIHNSNLDLDIRILFSNPENRISKNSKTTYGMVAAKLGFLFGNAKYGIPESWLTE